MLWPFLTRVGSPDWVTPAHVPHLGSRHRRVRARTLVGHGRRTDRLWALTFRWYSDQTRACELPIPHVLPWPTAVGFAVPCRVSPTSPTERSLSALLNHVGMSGIQLAMPFGHDLRVEAWVVMSDATQVCVNRPQMQTKPLSNVAVADGILREADQT